MLSYVAAVPLLRHSTPALAHTDADLGRVKRALCSLVVDGHDEVLGSAVAERTGLGQEAVLSALACLVGSGEVTLIVRGPDGIRVEGVPGEQTTISAPEGVSREDLWLCYVPRAELLVWYLRMRNGAVE